MKPWMRWSLWGILIFGAIFGVLRYYVLDFYRMPEDAVDPFVWANSPNLEPGDFVLVWRVGKPHIGDVVRCPDPSATPEAPRWLIARVIGITGDKIEINEGQLRINGFRVPTGACVNQPRKVIDQAGTEVDMTCYSEELGGGKHDVQVLPNSAPLGPVELVVGPGKLFLLSDNRSPPWNHDSREVGQVELESCSQRLAVRLVSKLGWKDADRRMGFLF
jgi:signal peptidase I